MWSKNDKDAGTPDLQNLENVRENLKVLLSYLILEKLKKSVARLEIKKINNIKWNTGIRFINTSSEAIL